jgi:tetratricopeptide (TPR) repeat protein
VAELTLDQALQKGVEAHKAGQVQEADRLYTAILKAQPKHPDANHNMGILAVGVGKIQEALPFFKTALEANPAMAQFWLSYIDTLIKLDKLADAKAVLDQAKSKGAKGDSFDKLEQRLKEASEKPLGNSQTALEVPPIQPNILDSLKLDQAIKLAKKKTKEGSPDEAKRIYKDILNKFPQNKRASDGLKALASRPVSKASKAQDPPQDQLQSLINLHSQGQLQQALKQAETLVQQFPKSATLFNIQGAALKGFGQLDQSIEAYSKALSIKPDYANAYYNMGVTLQEQGKLEEAIEAYNKALAIKPDYADAYYNMGNAFKEQGKLEEAIEAYNKALAIKPDYADAYYNMGIVLKDQGKLEEAIEAYNEALAIKPDYADAYYNMGVTLQEQGKLEEAVEAYNKALAIKPDYADAYYNIGNAFKEQGKLEEAIEAYNKALAIKPDYAEAYNNMGSALQEQGNREEAIEAYNNALALKPDYAEAHNNMGNALKKQGKLEEAIEAYNKALAIKPDYADAYYNMGVTLQEQGKLEEAIEAYNKALAIKPDNAEAYNNMGITLKEQGKLEEAIEAYNKALAIKPNKAEAYNNMGSALQDQGKLEEAIEAYNKALAIKLDYAEAWLNGAEALEKWNKLKELGLWLERAFQILEPVPSDISFMKAKLLWRNKDTQEAIKLISNIDVETIKPIRKQDYLNLKAKCCEASKDYDLAYDCFKRMNSFAIKSNDYLGLNPELYFQNIKAQLASLKSNSLENPINSITEQPDLVPVFLVGFPRSGTTLLDTILRSHSNIDVVEEQPLVRSAQAFVEKSGYPELAQTLPKEVISRARKAYITELDKHRESTDNKSILIDKLPLNLLQIPLIQQLYPRTKYILALRHPLDTILSCWMQNFKLNDAMANMVDLERIVDFYSVAMETFKICRAKYNLNVHEIRYEDLIEDLNGETSALLKFLDLDWEAQMENYQDTALKRGRINTPSYSQVVQPIYKDAKYRWLNYEKHLRQYITQVEPWINEFGYSNT